jgi:hypothetical protein
VPQPLPPQDDENRIVELANDLPSSSLSQPVPSRSSSTLGSRYGYLIHVSQRGQSLGSVTILTHEKLFKQPELDAMVTEVAKVVDDTRIAERRKSMAAGRVPVDAELNERLFPSDVEFFEAVMMDKFQFQRLNTMVASAAIEPTAKAAAA